MTATPSCTQWLHDPPAQHGGLLWPRHHQAGGRGSLQHVRGGHWGGVHQPNTPNNGDFTRICSEISNYVDRIFWTSCIQTFNLSATTTKLGPILTCHPCMVMVVTLTTSLSSQELRSCTSRPPPRNPPRHRARC